MITALRHIFHEHGSVEEAEQLFQGTKAGELTSVPLSV
jgi:hypothetical protein